MSILRRMSKSSGKSHFLAAGLQQLTFKNESVTIRKRSRLAQNHGSVVHHLSVDRELHQRIFHSVDKPGSVQQASSGAREQVVHHDHSCLAFNYGAAGGTALIGIVERVITLVFGVPPGPFVQVIILVM